LNSDNSINRDKLGEIVFKDADKRRQLNRALHGLIRFEMLKQVLVELFRGTRFVILDVPLLFEVKAALHLMSYKVVIYCENEQERVQRLIRRNPNLSESEARLRIEAQMNAKDQLKLADFVIDNSKDIDHTRKQVKDLVQTFRQSRKYLIIRLGLIAFSGLLLSGLFFILRCLKS
jgi:dephospho-CoA kinase